MTLSTKKRKCSDCGLTFDVHDIEWNGAVVFLQKQCEKCAEAAWKAFELEEEARQQRGE